MTLPVDYYSKPLNRLDDCWMVLSYLMDDTVTSREEALDAMEAIVRDFHDLICILSSFGGLVVAAEMNSSDIAAYDIAGVRDGFIIRSTGFGAFAELLRDVIIRKCNFGDLYVRGALLSREGMFLEALNALESLVTTGGNRREFMKLKARCNREVQIFYEFYVRRLSGNSFDPGNPQIWSKPRLCKEWADLFDISVREFSRRRRSGKITVHPNSSGQGISILKEHLPPNFHE